jgi:uncharacterized membrane protein
MVTVGVVHFVNVEPFMGMMPPWVPFPLAMVYISGAFEILGGLGLILERTRSAAGWGLVALYVAVFPANIYMAINELPLGDQPVEPWILWARLPFQFLFIAWAYWVSRPHGTERT